ncbi:MAG: sugar phosphate isomerase/epimerase family protein [Verrucomicrobiota bacterium]
MNRRRFLDVTAAAAAFSFSETALARDPIERSGPARLRLALAAYSFRRHFAFMKGKPQAPAPGTSPLNLFRFIDYCAEQQVEGAELTAYFFPPDADADYFRNLKRHAHFRGVTISGTAIGNDFSMGPGAALNAQIEETKASIVKAAQLGAPHLRVFAGTARGFAKAPENLDHSIAALNECAEFAGNHGVILGVENHGNLTADQMLTLMKGVDSPWIGINLDTGNFFSDDPYGDLEACVPYAVNVQAKVVMRRPDKTKYPADFDRIGQILRAGNYQGFVVMEYEEESPFEQVPGALAELRNSLADPS